VGKFEISIAPSRCVTVLLSCVSFGVAAQDLNQSAIKVGEADFFPSIRLGGITRDNVFAASSDQTDATGFLIAPSAILKADRRGLDVTLGYEGEYASFSEDAVSYDDHNLFGAVEAVVSTRKRVSASAALKLDHQELGTGLSRGAVSIGSEQVERFIFDANAAYTYGAPTARFNVTAGLDLDSVTFQNRPDITDGRDHTEFTPYGRISYRLNREGQSN